MSCRCEQHRLGIAEEVSLLRGFRLKAFELPGLERVRGEQCHVLHVRV